MKRMKGGLQLTGWVSGTLGRSFVSHCQCLLSWSRLRRIHPPRELPHGMAWQSDDSSTSCSTAEQDHYTTTTTTTTMTSNDNHKNHTTLKTRWDERDKTRWQNCWAFWVILRKPWLRNLSLIGQTAEPIWVSLRKSLSHTSHTGKILSYVNPRENTIWVRRPVPQKSTDQLWISAVHIRMELSRRPITLEMVGQPLVSYLNASYFGPGCRPERDSVEKGRTASIIRGVKSWW